MVTGKIVDTHATLGLRRKVVISKIIIDGENRILTVTTKVVVLSPTDVIVQTIEENTYTRTGVYYDNLEASAIGVGIKQMLEQLDLVRVLPDLSNYPACLTQGYTAP